MKVCHMTCDNLPFLGGYPTWVILEHVMSHVGFNWHTECVPLPQWTDWLGGQGAPTASHSSLLPPNCQPDLNSLL